MNELERVVRMLPPGHEVITGTRASVVQEIRRAERRGELMLIGPGVYPISATGREVYAVVRRLRRSVPAWRRPALLAGGTLLGVGAVLAMVWIVLSVLASVAGAVSLGALAVLLVVRTVRGQRGPRVEMVQRVTLRS